MPINERAYLQKISQSSPSDLTDAVRHAGPDEARALRIYLGTAQFDQIQAISARAVGMRGAPLGNVVVLHGIMGSELTLFNNDGQTLIWVQVLHLLQGQFDRLGLDSQGLSQRDVRATGMYMRFYGSQLASLSTNWNVRPFFFDWRRDIRVAADELNTNVTTWFGPEAPFHLIAHSMGGLVARCFISRHPDRWNKGGENAGRLVMLGTPNNGSFAIPRLLFGTNEVLNTVAKVDFSHDAKDLLNIAKTFDGAYQMLPVRGKLDGLDVLYRAQTYTVAQIDQALLDQAEVFQHEIAGTVDPDRMVYVAGYNRRTMAGINDPNQLGADAGYFFSLKGDGTVPHNLGLLDGVKTFYLDEEHQNLPSNTKVQSAMTELLQTGTQQTEQFLWKGLGPQFAGERGAAVSRDGPVSGPGFAEPSQSTMQAAEAARKSIKEQQAIALRNLLMSRGSVDGDTVSAEEVALADVIMKHDPLPLSVGVDGTVASAAQLATAPVQAPEGSNGLDLGASARVPPPHTSIRIHVLAQDLDTVAPDSVKNEIPIDCIAVGHYLRVKPTGGELDLDRAISKALRPSAATPSGAAPPENTPGPANTASSQEDLLITQFHERGILRGDLGTPFYLPDPRRGYERVLLAIAGMGPVGEFGIPELTLLARDLSWSLGQLGKKHLATVLIGASKKNLSYSDAIHAWLVGLNRALAGAAGAGAQGLESITFVIRPPKDQAGESRRFDVQSAAVAALKREADHMREEEALYNFDPQLIEMPPVKTTASESRGDVAATRISIEFDDGTCTYSAMTDSASIPERKFHVNPKRISDINSRLLVTNDSKEKYLMGKFLLDYLFPRDLRSQLTGSAPVVLACNNEAAKVYWELAAEPMMDPDSGPVADDSFLGLARGLTRQLKTVLAPPPEPPPPIGKILRILVVADACRERPLPGAQEEAQRLLALFDRVNNTPDSSNRIAVTALIGPSKATTLDVLLHINDQPPFDVLHYAGHCCYDEQHPEKSGFLFSDDDVLTAEDLDRIDRTPKFVFANACESGVLPSRPDLSSPGLPAAFAEAFFEKGVANFICTAWPVEDDASRDFAVELYRYLLGADKDAPVSMMYEALRMARKKIAETRTWAAYQHYGSPYYQLFRRR